MPPFDWSVGAEVGTPYGTGPLPMGTVQQTGPPPQRRLTSAGCPELWSGGASSLPVRAQPRAGLLYTDAWAVRSPARSARIRQSGPRTCPPLGRRASAPTRSHASRRSPRGRAPLSNRRVNRRTAIGESGQEQSLARQQPAVPDRKPAPSPRRPAAAFLHSAGADIDQAWSAGQGAEQDAATRVPGCGHFL